jgi:WD40 repeat protein/serine/threonine protein kinase
MSDANPHWRSSGSPNESALAGPSAASPEETTGPSEKTGEKIGRYKLRERIGEGGYGVVYAAEQEEPIRRRVALKVIKLGMDTRSVIARFEAERQALARMDHPNIAKVLDAGSTESGRPYFVMDLVRGVRFTDYCDQNTLSTHDRLGLFIAVCHAVQHAHQKGIIHRDLKPSNILVTLHDGKPVPKVIDFGIAKATEGRLTDATVYTQLQQCIGTPAYMSPEQAEMSGLDPDTRSDIYSLGVVLYELLAGSTPYEGKELAAAGVEAMRWRLRETDPVRPSTRLSSLKGQELAWIAKHRAAEPARLVSLIRGDLDWIVMKCLEKDRTRRYETASALALDIEHYLNSQPVTARPPSTSYRLQKFVRRNRLMMGAACLVAVTLLLGLAGSLWQAVRATHAERVAREKSRVAEAEQQRATEAARVAAAQKQRAEEGELRARQEAYASDINLAQKALAEYDLGRAKRLLELHRPRPGQLDLRGWEWRYLWGQCRTEAISELCRRAGDAYSVSWSPDGQMLAMAGLYETSVEVWNVTDRTRLATLQTNTGRFVAFSPRGDLLAADNLSVNDDLGPINLWQAGTTNLVRQLPETNGCVGLRFSPAGTQLAVLNWYGDVSIWDVYRGVLLRSIPPLDPQPTDFTSFTFSPDGKRLAIGGVNGKLRVVALNTGATVFNIEAYSEERVSAVAWSPTDQVIATGSGFMGGPLRLWDANSGRLVGELDGHCGWVSGLIFSADGKFLYSCAGDQTIRIWDVAQRRCARVLRGSRDEVLGLALSPDGTTLASGGKDGVVAFWSTVPAPEEVQPKLVLTEEKRKIPIAAAFDPAGDTLALVRGGIVRLHELPSLKETSSIPALGTNVRSLAYSPDGKLLATGSTNGWLRVWSRSERRLLKEVAAHNTNRVNRLRFSADGTRLLSGVTPFPEFGITGELAVWDTRTWEAVWSCSFTNMDFIAISPDGRLVLETHGTKLFNDELGWWDTTSRKRLAVSSSHRFGFVAAAFSPDGKHLASVAEDGTMTVWDTGSFHPLTTFKAHINAVYEVAFSADGRRLLTSGGTGREAARVWDFATRRELLTLTGRGSWCNLAAFSRDDNYLVAGNYDQQLYLWHAPSWAEIEAAEKAAEPAP